MKYVLIIAIILILLAVSGCEIEQKVEEKILNQAQVSRVIDGDTLELASDEKIRLLHINTPEKGEHCYQEATDRLTELALNKTIWLERDMQSLDHYNRSLRYIYLEKDSDKSVNQILVEEGYAVAYILLPNTKYHQQFVDSERQAIENKKGCLWQNVSEYYGCFEVQELMKCEQGDYIILRNNCQDINIDNWLLRNQGRSRYSLSGIIDANSTIKIEREGWESNHDCIWSDWSDTLFLFDDQDRFVLRHHY